MASDFQIARIIRRSRRRPHVSPLGFASDVECAHWMTKEIGVAPVPGSSFFPYSENRYVRLNFAKGVPTLRAAGERLVRLRDER